MKTNFAKIIAPHCHVTARILAEEGITLCLGDTTFLDYEGINQKR